MGDIQDQITRAIGAHGMWKARLMAAIESGKFDVSPADVALDDRCEFGKWLHGATLTALHGTADFDNVVRLHAGFHKVAADVVGAALRGDKAGASARMSGEFADVSAKLTTAMMRWKATG